MALGHFSRVFYWSYHSAPACFSPSTANIYRYVVGFAVALWLYYLVFLLPLRQSYHPAFVLVLATFPMSRCDLARSSVSATQEVIFWSTLGRRLSDAGGVQLADIRLLAPKQRASPAVGASFRNQVIRASGCEQAAVWRDMLHVFVQSGMRGSLSKGEGFLSVPVDSFKA